jgi:hypothetical protein
VVRVVGYVKLIVNVNSGRMCRKGLKWYHRMGWKQSGFAGAGIAAG